MTYETPEALRMALEHRLNSRASETGIAIDRLRRRVIFERVVARLTHAEPGKWVLKGGMALEVRLQDRARLTQDIDLGLRDVIKDRIELQERLVDALAPDPFNDRFVLAAGSPSSRPPMLQSLRSSTPPQIKHEPTRRSAASEPVTGSPSQRTGGNTGRAQPRHPPGDLG